MLFRSDLAASLDASTAAVIIEPMCYETFERASPEFMAEVYRLCRDRGVLVIMDETRTGLGRTGTMWAAEAFAGAPDLLITGKGLSGGIYPVSACVMTEGLYESCVNAHEYGYASSLAGNELACLVAARVLELSSEPALLGNVRNRAKQALQSIAVLTRRYQGVFLGGDANGLAIHIRLQSAEFAEALNLACVNAGLLCHSVSRSRGPMIKLMPPLVIDEATLSDVFSRLEAAMIKVLDTNASQP